MLGQRDVPDGVRSLIELRRAQHVELSAMQPPDSFVLPEGTYLPLYEEASKGAEESLVGITLLGIGACGGHGHGRAAVLSGVEESG